MINFKDIASKKEVIVPIIGNSFQYNRKKYNFSPVFPTEDGWYKVIIQGNDVKVGDPVFIDIEILDVPTIKGYTYNNHIIFQNFDVAKRKLNKEVMAPLLLNPSPTFNEIEAYIWEDGKLFYYSGLFMDLKMIDVKTYFDSGTSIIDMKGITPEIKTLYLFHEIEKQKLRKELELKQKETEKKEYLKSLPGRLTALFQRAGATLVKFTKKAQNRIEVIWKIDNYSNEFNSIIDATSFSVIEAGYCMSGDDKRHNVTSMILTADDYAQRNKIHRTRGDRW